ncbi:uncharacterized protein EI90DRAFT_3046804, partial [Cantharellus anzutake]|uniref:uncharacterized protein n=1 Tax=Cantharellus anzutake TaxID=1750568 RepID=UPI001905119C
MRLAAPIFTRTANGPDSGLFRVNSAVFENVPIPRHSPSPNLRAPPLRPFLIRLPSEKTNDEYDCSAASTPSFGPQPSIELVKPTDGPWINASTFATPASPQETEGRCYPRIFFILGFFFPLLWAVGGAFLWRKIDTSHQPEAGMNTPQQSTEIISRLRDRDDTWAWRCIAILATEILLVCFTLLVLYRKNI